jgi:hypothetical protein
MQSAGVGKMQRSFALLRMTKTTGSPQNTGSPCVEVIS